MPDQLTVLRHESSSSQLPTVLVDQNGAVDGDELRKCIDDLRTEVKMLRAKDKRKKDIPFAPVVASMPTEQHRISTSSTVDFVSPVHSACAGIPPDQVESNLLFHFPQAPKVPPSPPSSPSSYASSHSGSDDLRRGRKGPPGPPSDPSPGGYSTQGSLRGSHSIGIGLEVTTMVEKDAHRSKDLSYVKIEALPSSAAEFRSWCNTLVTRVSAIDQTGKDVILAWLMEGFDAHLTDSGILPRLDAHLGSLFMDPRHLKGELGIHFQTYAQRK